MSDIISPNRRIETGNYKSVSDLEILEKFKRRFNLSAIAKTDGNTLTPFVIPAKPTTNFNIVKLSVPNTFGEVRGDDFQALDDCSFLAKRDMFSVSVNLNIVAEWDSNRVVLAGVGFGSKTNIPTMFGQLVNGNYISRFRQSKAGRGGGREDTFALSVGLAGKATIDPSVPGIVTGDFIFPVLWTPESQSVTIQIRDMIMTVSETIA